MTDSLAEEFQQHAGRALTVEFASCLNQTLNKEPAFSAAVCADTVLAFEALLKSQTNARQDIVELACSTFAAALYNACSDYKCTIVEADR